MMVLSFPALALPKIRRARIDHAAGAAEAGLPLRPTEYRHPLRLHLGFEPVHCVHRLVTAARRNQSICRHRLHSRRGQREVSSILG